MTIIQNSLRCKLNIKPLSVWHDTLTKIDRKNCFKYKVILFKYIKLFYCFFQRRERKTFFLTNRSKSGWSKPATTVKHIQVYSTVLLVRKKGIHVYREDFWMVRIICDFCERRVSLTVVLDIGDTMDFDSVGERIYWLERAE